LRRLAPLVPVAAIVGGVLAGGRGPASAGIRPLALAALAAAVALVWRARAVRTAAALVALAALAGGLTLRARHGMDDSPLAPLIAQRERVVLTGRLAGDPVLLGRLAIVDLRADGVASPEEAGPEEAGPEEAGPEDAGPEDGPTSGWARAVAERLAPMVISSRSTSVGPVASSFLRVILLALLTIRKMMDARIMKLMRTVMN